MGELGKTLGLRPKPCKLFKKSLTKNCKGNALRAFLGFILVLLVCLLLTACGSGDEETYEHNGEIFVEMPSPVPLDEPNGFDWSFTPPAGESPLEFLPFIMPAGPFSRLTGLPICEENLYRRPFAAVINNSARALPQSGIASADIVYEVLAEGDVTRLVGIFQSYVPEKLGPMRSARDYFIDFALNHDALFIHHGSSPSGYSRIHSLRVTNLDGMALEGAVFWRDRSYPEWTGITGNRPFEHSSFTGIERLAAHLESRGIRDYWHEDSYAFGFNFGAGANHPQQLGANLEGGQAYAFTVPFSALYFRRFIFNPATGLYLAENRHGPHLDAETGEQVAVGSVLIQFANMRAVDGEGRLSIDTVGSGTGYLVSGGQYQPVRWAKDSHVAPMRWYFADGTPLTLAPGRVWICVFRAGGTIEFE